MKGNKTGMPYLISEMLWKLGVNYFTFLTCLAKHADSFKGYKHWERKAKWLLIAVNMIIFLENTDELTFRINEKWLEMLNYKYSKINNFSICHNNQCKYVFFKHILLTKNTECKGLSLRRYHQKLYKETFSKFY